MDRLLMQLERNHWEIVHRVDRKPMPREDLEILIAALRHHIADEGTRARKGLIV
jgi:hypothetical protein